MLLLLVTNYIVGITIHIPGNLVLSVDFHAKLGASKANSSICIHAEAEKNSKSLLHRSGKCIDAVWALPV